MSFSRPQRHHQFLRALQNGTPAQARLLTLHASQAQQETMAEVAHNALQKVIPIPPVMVRALQPDARHIRKYANPNLTPGSRGKMTRSQLGGWLSGIMRKIMKKGLSKAARRGLKRSAVKAVKRSAPKLQRQLKNTVREIRQRADGIKEEEATSPSTTPHHTASEVEAKTRELYKLQRRLKKLGGDQSGGSLDGFMRWLKTGHLFSAETEKKTGVHLTL